MKKQTMPSRERIADYQFSHHYEGDMGCDESEGAKYCWRCGYKRILHRHHIIPEAIDGQTTLWNLALLCGACHVEAPHVRDPRVFWQWIKRDHGECYNTYWTSRTLKAFIARWGEARLLTFSPEKYKKIIEQDVGFFFDSQRGGLFTEETRLWAMEQATIEGKEEG